MDELMKQIEAEAKKLRLMCEEADEIGLKPANPLSVFNEYYERKKRM